jgi:hypothetical protein
MSAAHTGTRFALRLGMNKRTNEPPKPRTQASRAEPQKRAGKAGAPGSEASKARSVAKDVRSPHDKDGNSEQRGR